MKRSGTPKPLSKRDLVDFVGPLFEELKTETRRLGVLMEQMNSKFETETRNLDGLVREMNSKSKTEARHLGVLMEQMNTKIDTALEVSMFVANHEVSVKDHSQRLDLLEGELTNLKLIWTQFKK